MRASQIRCTESGYDSRVVNLGPSTSEDKSRVALSIGKSYWSDATVKVNIDDKERLKFIAALMDDDVIHLAYVARMVSQSILCAITSDSDEDKLDAIRYLIDHRNELTVAIEPLVQAFCTLHSQTPEEFGELVSNIAKG